MINPRKEVDGFFVAEKIENAVLDKNQVLREIFERGEIAVLEAFSDIETVEVDFLKVLL